MSDMNDTTARAARLIDALTGAILSTVETAAERIELAAQAAQARQRAEALALVLEGVAAHRAALEEKLATAAGPMKALLAHQIAAVERQEVLILCRAGLSEEAASAVFAQPAALPEPKPGKIAVRAHERRKGGVEALNGAGVEN